MVKYLSIFVLSYFFLFPVTAQEHRTMGLIFDSVALRDIPRIPDYKGIKNISLPTEVNLKPFCPTPSNQGPMGACVGYAFSYGAMTIMNAIQKGYTAIECINEERFSPHFLFNHIRVDSVECKGASLEAAANFLKEKGVCLLKDYDEPLSCALPDSEIWNQVKTFSIKQSGLLFDWNTEDHIKIIKLKEALSANTPVVVGIKMYQSFMDYKYSKYKTYWKKAKLDHYIRNGAHSIVVVGYNEELQTFDIMNSWGTGWGNKGFASIDYEAMAEMCRTAYQIIPHDNFGAILGETANCTLPVIANSTSSDIILSKNISVKNPKRIIEKEPVLYLEGQFTLIQLEQLSYLQLEEDVQFNSSLDLYETYQESFDTNALLQISSSKVPVGKYVYIFSCDPKGKVELHYPKLDKKVAQFIPRDNIEIIYPSDTTALKFSHLGEEIWGILYSDEIIEDIKPFLGSLTNYSAENIWSKLAAAFGKRLLPAKAINYAPRKMHASATSTKSRGYILPILLRVKVQE